MTDTKKPDAPAPTPTNPPPGPQSTKPVAPGSTTIKDPDEAPKNPIPDNQAANDAKAKEDAAVAKAKVDAEAAAIQKAKDNAEFEAARAEKDGNLTPEQQAAIDKLNGDHPEEGPIDDEHPVGGAPDDLKEVFDKFRKLHAAIPETTPDSHTIWGAGGVVLTLGDVRTLIRYMR